MRVLRWALETPCRYIGMVDSERKYIRVAKQLEKECIAREKLDRVYSPVGLDIGALTPEEIAVSIVAEMIAVRRGKSARHMSWTRKQSAPQSEPQTEQS